VEGIRKIEGLALEELEAQTLDLLPDREEMSLVAYPNVNKVLTQYNQALQVAASNTNDHSFSQTGNVAKQGNFGINY
jgi:hypothetical protein